MRFRRVVRTITCTRSPAERITDSPEEYPQHVDDTFCSDKLYTECLKVMLDQEFPILVEL